MAGLRGITIGVVLAGGLGAFVALTRGPPPPSPTPPGAFSFAALGDAPYYWFEDLQYEVVLADIAAHELSVVVHVGDILDGDCGDERYRRTLDQFGLLPHPVIYTPGDNEWADCWANGDFAPLERLARLRETFFGDPGTSLGGRPVPLESQAEQEAFAAYREHARWTHEGVLFATVHLVGSWNATASAGRTEGGDAEAERRLEAATAWLRESFTAAREAAAPAVVVGFHANVALEDPDTPRRTVFDPFIAALEEEVERFGGPVLVVHGDWHDYTVDRPLTSRATGRLLENLTRLQVPGSFDVGWVRVTVAPGADEPFTFEPRVVPRWKYW